MPKLDETENEFRYRLRDPGGFDLDSFRAKKLPEDGLSLIIGKLKVDDSGSIKAQSIRFSKKNWDKSKAMMWVKSHKDTFSVDPDDLFSQKNVDIFATGEWNGRKITEKDLDNIVEAFNKTKKTVRPYLKLGHDDDQKLLQSDGLPAAGWIESVRRVGDKLKADFVDIPKKIYKLINNKAYRKVSCEIYRNVKIDGKTYPRMLSAVSLLGADMPAVLNLDDILSLYSHDKAFASIESFTTAKNCDIITTDQVDDPKKKDDAMPDEKLKFQLEQEQAKAKKLEETIEDQKKTIEKFSKDIDAINEKLAEKDKTILEAQTREQKAKIEKFTSELIADKLCSKAMKPLIEDLLDDSKEKYSRNEKEFDKFGLIKEIFSLAKDAAKVNFDDATGKSDENANTPDHDKIEKYAQEKGISYSKAYRELNRSKDD